jgi:hypothetical protein
MRFGDVVEKVVPSAPHHRLAPPPVYAQNPCNIVPSNAGGGLEPNAVTSLLVIFPRQKRNYLYFSFLLTSVKFHRIRDTSPL